MGTFDVRHFISYIKVKKLWHLFDDIKVIGCDGKVQLESDEVNILFYERVA